MGKKMYIPIEVHNGRIISNVNEQLECMTRNLANGGHYLVAEVKGESRSLNQNALLHVWCRCIARELGYLNEEYAKRAICNVLLTEVQPNGEKVAKHTSALSKEEFSAFMDTLQAWAYDEFNITLPSPTDPAYPQFELEYK